MYIRKYLGCGAVSVSVLAIAMGLVACGDDSSAGGGHNESLVLDVNLANGNKVACNSEMEGVVAITADAGYRRCEGDRWVEISEDDALAADKIIGAVEEMFSSSSKDGNSGVTPGSDSESPSGSSSSSIAKVSSDSKEEGSSSSETISSSSKNEDSSDIPESPCEVKPAGYYKNYCPAGYECKDATTTDFLNSAKTYEEILDTRDGQVYKTIVICDKNDENCQTWMAQNLNYAPTNVSSMGGYAWSGCYGEGSEGLTEEQVAANGSKYGRLYTWEVAMNKTGCGYESYCNNSNEGSQGVCPHGWRLPTKEDWQKLVKPMAANVDDFTTYWYYNGAGVELKSVDGWHENSSSMVGTNASGFSAIPGGIRDHYGDFNDIGNYAHFWSASEINSNEAYTMFLFSERGEANLLNYTKFYAFSVRCLKDL